MSSFSSQTRALIDANKILKTKSQKNSEMISAPEVFEYLVKWTKIDNIFEDFYLSTQYSM